MKVEEQLEEAKAQFQEERDRLHVQLEDFFAAEHEQILRDDEALKQPNQFDDIQDLDTALKAIKTLRNARGILEKKLTTAERNLKGVDYQLNSLQKTSKEQAQQITLMKARIEKLKGIGMSLVDITGMVENCKITTRADIRDENLTRAEETLKYKKYHVTNSENALRKVWEVKHKLTQLSSHREPLVRQEINALPENLQLDDPSLASEDVPQRAKSPARRATTKKLI